MRGRDEVRADNVWDRPEIEAWGLLSNGSQSSDPANARLTHQVLQGSKHYQSVAMQP